MDKRILDTLPYAAELTDAFFSNAASSHPEINDLGDGKKPHGYRHEANAIPQP
jgi:hypothetical protein